jgi:hypothetical protein
MGQSPSTRRQRAMKRTLVAACMIIGAGLLGFPVILKMWLGEKTAGISPTVRRYLPLIFAVAMALLNGCTSPTGVESPGSIPTNSLISEPLEAPKDGKILVLISGNARASGRLWVREDATFATIENLFSAREYPSRHVEIVRFNAEGTKSLRRYRIDKMSRSEKERVKLYHGDSIIFVRDRCFSFAPNELLLPTTSIEHLNY